MTLVAERLIKTALRYFAVPYKSYTLTNVMLNMYVRLKKHKHWFESLNVNSDKSVSCFIFGAML